MNKQHNKENKTICKLRLVITIVSFVCGILIAGSRVHLLSPIGEYTSSAISILREVLILYGAIIGIYGNSGYR
jgi:Na+-transporting NADH:ubiquinone oxidoreductase subunit NqrC